MHELRNMPRSEVYFDLAHEIIPKFLGELRGLDWSRCLGMLAIYGWQTGRSDVLHHYLGLYLGAVSLYGMDDEKNWPNGMNLIELELGRRLVSISQSVVVVHRN